MPRYPESYYRHTHELEPSSLLVEAFDYLRSPGSAALDLGCGAGRDTNFLLANNFTVTAVDAEINAEKYIQQLYEKGDVTFVHSTFDAFNYDHYDLVNARYTLPFSPPETFPQVMDKIVTSLNPGGIFVGQLFGVNDGWNTSESTMTFHTASDAQKLFSSLEIIKFDEVESDGELANGSAKHWHVFDIIARKQ